VTLLRARRPVVNDQAEEEGDGEPVEVLAA
jgi:hypothetical protein